MSKERVKIPLGVFIIDWDELEGGVISMKYPKDLKVPVDFVQLLHISHNFNPGLMTIKEEDFHALSMGNIEAQKVIVLQLSKYEDSEDFSHIVETINEIIEVLEEEELKRLFELSQHAYKAREAVLQKLANEVADARNIEADYRKILKWLYKHERTWAKKIIILLALHNALNSDQLSKKTGLPISRLKGYIEGLENDKIIEKTNGKYRLGIIYD